MKLCIRAFCMGLFSTLAFAALPVCAHASPSRTMMPDGLVVELVPGNTTPVAVRLTSTTTMTLCGEITPLQVAISRDLNFIDIDTGSYTLTQKPPGTCVASPKFARAQIDIPPGELQQFEITQIRFWSGPRMDSYNVSFADGTMTLTPPGKIKFFRPASPEKLRFQFMAPPALTPAMPPQQEMGAQESGEKMVDKNIVTVWVQGYPESDVEAQLGALLESRGLKPVEAVQMAQGQIATLHAIDTGGQFALQARYGGPVVLGRIGAVTNETTIAAGGPAKQTFDVLLTLP